MRRDVVICGAGGFGREVAQWAHDAGWRVAGWLDDDPAKAGTEIAGLPVLGAVDDFPACGGRDVLIGVGIPELKRRLAARLAALGACFPPLLHPTARVGARVIIGDGVVLCPGVIVTVDCVLGAFAMVNLDVTIGHDCRIGTHATISPGVHLSGYTTVGAGCDLGTGAVTIPGVTIGAESVIGAGAVVTRDLPPGVVAVGVPAKVVKEVIAI